MLCDLPSSSNFDSDLEAGCHKHVVDKHLKLDEPFLSDFKTTQPRPIKVADQIPIGSRLVFILAGAVCVVWVFLCTRRRRVPIFYCNL
jgi:hypothetical protein